MEEYRVKSFAELHDALDNHRRDAGWIYRGPDLFSATSEEVAALAHHLNQTLLPLGSDWMVSVDAIRATAAPYPGTAGFPDPVTALIDDERRAAYGRNRANFETRTVLTLTHMPPAELEARAARWLVAGRDRERVDWPAQIDAFRSTLDDLEDLFAARLELQRLDSPTLLQHLHACLTGLDAAA